MSFEEMRANEQLAAIEEFVSVSHPELGALSLPKSPFAGMASVEPLRPAPLLGADTATVVASAVDAQPWVLAGPLGNRILANPRAEVIKVESESRMDSIPWIRPASFWTTLTAGGWFNDANTGKLSVTMNTKAQDGRDLLRRLAARWDIVIDNLRPGGLNVITGWEGAPPTGLGVAFADFVSPSLVASAVIAAVIEPDRTGVGQEIDMSQLPGMISLMSAEWMRFATVESRNLAAKTATRTTARMGSLLRLAPTSGLPSPSNH